MKCFIKRQVASSKFKDGNRKTSITRLREQFRTLPVDETGAPILSERHNTHKERNGIRGSSENKGIVKLPGAKSPARPELIIRPELRATEAN